jgi:hypothetical protein
MDQDYKARKEAFVSNHLGGGIDEINAVTLVASVSPWAFFRRLTEANNDMCDDHRPRCYCGRRSSLASPFSHRIPQRLSLRIISSMSSPFCLRLRFTPRLLSC